MENAFTKKNNQFLHGPDLPATQPDPWTRPTLAPLSTPLQCGPTCWPASPLRAPCDRESPPNPLPTEPKLRRRHPPLLGEPCADAVPSCFLWCGTSLSPSPSCRITGEAPSYSSLTANAALPQSAGETRLLCHCARDLVERLQPISRNLTAKTFSFFVDIEPSAAAPCACPAGVERASWAL
jgi:hypothetical protein